MAVSSDYLNALANHGAGLVKYIGLVDGTGVELSGGNYARKAVTWTTSPTGGTAGLVRPSADLLFNVPAGTVGGWRGYSALTSGTNYGGETYAPGGGRGLLSQEAKELLRPWLLGGVNII